VLVGGNGRRRTLPLVARFADEWNAIFITPDGLRERNALLDELLVKAGRRPEDVRRSMMTGLIFGRDQAEFEVQLRDRDAGALRERGLVVGTPGAVVDQLGRLADAGLQRVMLQWLDLDALDRLEGLADAVLTG
jgi:alkanesulfonate monooxygenase SsuD/methylene tetrahydromethanopterin reductase-like flavin-dependent oxidoreductase (luciferase family)